MVKKNEKLKVVKKDEKLKVVNKIVWMQDGLLVVQNRVVR